jgi:hypothetical protein
MLGGLVAAGLGLGCGERSGPDAAAGAPPVVPDAVEAVPAAPAVSLADREAELAVLALAGENEELRSRIASLEQRIGDLSEALAGVKPAGTPAGLAPAAERVLPGREASTGPRPLRVIDANEDLQMVVLDGGENLGLKVGMRFTLLAGGRPIARARVVEVRARIAGAEVEERWDGAFPGVGTDAIRWSAAER